MKKLLLVLLALVMCLSLFACGGKEINTSRDDDSSKESSAVNSIVGKYMVLSMSEGDVTFNYETLVSLGATDSYIEFKADGTFTMSVFGEDPTNGTYDDTAKTLTAEGETVSYTLDGDTVTINLEGAVMKFTKGALPEVSVPVVSDPVFDFSDDEDFEESSEDIFESDPIESDPVESDPIESDPEIDDGFVGDYVIESMYSGGYDFSYDDLTIMGLETSYLKIRADGTFVMSFNGAVGEGTYDEDTQTLDAPSGSVSYEVYGDEIVLSFEDAATSEPVELTFVKGEIPDVETPDISTDVSDPDTSAPASGSTEAATPAKYMIYSMSMSGMELDYATLASMQMADSYLEIRADGTFTMYLTGEDEVNGTHEADARTLTAEDEPISYTVDGDIITLSEEGFSVSFTKGELPNVGADTDVSEPDEPIEGNGEISAGKYMIYSMEAEGMSINQSMLESLGLADSYIEFKADGTFVMALTDEDPVSGTYDDTAKTLSVNGESVDYTVSGNKVSLDIEGSKMTFAK